MLTAVFCASEIGARCENGLFVQIFVQKSCKLKNCVLYCLSICLAHASNLLEVKILLNFLLASGAALTVFIVKIVLAVLSLVCVGFIITVVMKQKGNSDGMEAMMGNSKSDDSETFYGKNSASRKEAKLKLWTYICAGVLAVCCIAFLLLGLIK